MQSCKSVKPKPAEQDRLPELANLGVLSAPVLALSERTSPLSGAELLRKKRWRTEQPCAFKNALFVLDQPRQDSVEWLEQHRSSDLHKRAVVERKGTDTANVNVSGKSEPYVALETQIR